MSDIYYNDNLIRGKGILKSRQMRVELFDRTALAVYTLPKCCDKLSDCCSSVKELLRTIMI